MRPFQYPAETVASRMQLSYFDADPVVGGVSINVLNTSRDVAGMDCAAFLTEALKRLHELMPVRVAHFLFSLLLFLFLFLSLSLFFLSFNFLFVSLSSDFGEL